MEYLSKERYNELSSELKHLINDVYPKVTEDLAEMSAQGDRSDNAGYREARRIHFPHFFRIGYGAIVGSSTHFAIKAVSAAVCDE